MLKKIVSVILVIILSITFYGCDNPSNNVMFDALMEKLFIDLVETDSFTINYMLRYPEKYGLEQVVPELPTPGSLEDFCDYRTFLQDCYDKVTAYSDRQLSEQQRDDRDLIADWLNRSLSMMKEDEFYYYKNDYLSPSLGWQAQLPSLLAEYRFDDKQDVLNYLHMLEQMPQTFQEYVHFEEARQEKGFGYNKTILDDIVSQCEQFVSNEDNILTETFSDRIQSLSFLNEAQKNDFISTNNRIIQEDVLPAYQMIASNLKQISYNAPDSNPIANFPKGKQYYQALFSLSTSTDDTIEQADAYLKSHINSLMLQMANLYVDQDEDFLNQIEQQQLPFRSAQDYLEELKQRCAQDFPDIAVNLKDVTMKEVHSSMRESSSPAFYVCSPIDISTEETFYINSYAVEKEQDLYCFGLYAHEAYPGHMYQHIYTKNMNLPPIMLLISYIGSSESWATYVEHYCMYYTDTNNRAVDAYLCYDRLTYLAIVQLDIGVNYYGWSVSEATQYLSQYFDETAVYYLYPVVEERPCNYSSYYYQYEKLLDLKESAKRRMGSEYTDYAFHKLILNCGSAPFWYIKKAVDSSGFDWMFWK